MATVTKISNIELNAQIRTVAKLILNKTGYAQDSELGFCQFDDYHAVGSDGCIYQIISKHDIHEGCTLVYSSGDVFFNYAEESVGFANEDDEAIFNHCWSIAEQIF